MYIVSAQTPYDEFTKKVDMSYVNAAIGDVLKVAPKGAIVVVESTIVIALRSSCWRCRGNIWDSLSRFTIRGLNRNEFLDSVDLVVIMVKHNEIKENMDKLVGKVVLDCYNICMHPNAYQI